MKHPLQKMVKPTTALNQYRLPGDLYGKSFGNWTKIFILALLGLVVPLGACKRAPLPPPVVLFDQGHGQHFLVENKGELDLSKLGETFKALGFQVKMSPLIRPLLMNPWRTFQP